jgi:flavodoxin I
MKNVAVVYWTQSGNTEAMANALAEGASTEATEVSSFSPVSVADYDALAFGCPAMGSEELDPDFEEVWNECVPNLGERSVALFVSYDWGTGEWMDTWRQAAEDAGVNVVDAVIANLEPDDEALARLRELGSRLAS